MDTSISTGNVRMNVFLYKQFSQLCVIRDTRDVHCAFQECSTYNCYVSCNGRRGSDLRTKNGPLIVVMLDATVEVTVVVADFPHSFS